MKDIFFEDNYTPVKGLIRRYKDRALVELTLRCPVECEFCYRKWKKEECRKELTKNDIDKIINYVVEHKEITEIIFSGGEPLMALYLFEYAIEKFKVTEQIKVFRIHTRAVITAPQLVSKKFLEILNRKYEQVIYLSIHVNSHEELSQPVIEAINKIRKTGVILYSQSVFLKNINDSFEVLSKLFCHLVQLGVRPYNIYQCNNIKGIEHFMVPLEKEIAIMTELRKKISGFACPTLIIDAPGNANKIPAPLGFWESKIDNFNDFDGKVTRTPGF